MSVNLSNAASMSASIPASAAGDAWTEPWWINPTAPRRAPASGSEARRPGREFTLLAGQLCLVAWMVGLMAEATISSLGWTPPIVAAWEQAIGTPVQASDGQSLPASVGHASAAAEERTAP